MSIRSLMDKRVDIYARVDSTGGAGSQAYTWPKITKTTMARLQPSPSQDIVMALQRDAQISHVIYFADDPSLNDRDQIQFDGRTFDVIGKAINFDEQARLWRAELLETEQRQSA